MHDHLDDAKPERPDLAEEESLPGGLSALFKIGCTHRLIHKLGRV